MLPSLSLLTQISNQIQNIKNKQGEYKRKIHYCCYLLCQKAGLRIGEAVKFDLNSKTRKGLYRINKPKGKKERFVYIPEGVIDELKKYHWKPNQTNRFNFYHFLKSIKKGLRISQNIELTPHTLRRAFATYHAENGLPLPLLQKLLGHKSIKTTALYWMNIYNEDNNPDDILTTKFWPKKPRWKLKLESEASVNLNLEELPKMLIENSPQPLASEPPPNYLTKIQQLENQLTREKTTLQDELTDLNEQNATLRQEKHQLQQNLTEKNQVIKELEQKLTNEREQKNATESNLAQAKQINNNFCQQLQTEQKNNASLTQKLHAYEQNHTNLINAYQITLKDKAKAEKQANYYEAQLKSIAQAFHQWQKLNYYQQLEKQRSELKAQIIHPPPFKPYK